MPSEDSFYYEGFSGPNGTIVPDDVFDVLAPHLKESELRVLLYIVRRTFGFGKTADAISLRQLTDGIRTRDGRILDQGTGMSRKAVVAGIRGLTDKGIITVHRHTSSRGDQSINVYRLRFRDSQGVTHGNPPGDPRSLPPVSDSTYPGGLPTPPPVTDGAPQDSVQDSEIHNNSITRVDVSPNTDNKELYERLKALGVHHNTAARLLRDYEPERIMAVVDHVSNRLRTGWQPGDSAAAWIVAALRDNYDIGTDDSVGSTDADEEAVAERERIHAEAMDRQLRRQREETLRTHGVEQNMEKLWQSVQRSLREEDAWSPVMGVVMLRGGEGGVLELLVPEAVRERALMVLERVEDALWRVLGEKRQLQVVRCEDAAQRPNDAPDM